MINEKTALQHCMLEAMTDDEIRAAIVISTFKMLPEDKRVEVFCKLNQIGWSAQAIEKLLKASEVKIHYEPCSR